MAAYMAAMTPGAEHEWMAKMAGDFTYVQKVWADPTTPASEEKGECHSEMILGGRYLSETMQGQLWGMPFEGHNLLAYDNITGTYQMSWVENMGTGIMNGSGKRDGNSISIICTSPDAITKKTTTFRCVTTLVNDKEHRYEMYMVEKKDKEAKFMEIVYTRK